MILSLFIWSRTYCALGRLSTFYVTFNHRIIYPQTLQLEGKQGLKLHLVLSENCSIVSCVSWLAFLQCHLDKQHLLDLPKWFLYSAFESNLAFS